MKPAYPVKINIFFCKRQKVVRISVDIATPAILIIGDRWWWVVRFKP